MNKVLIEKCLNNVPNKFELSVLAMNRAKEILLGAKTNVETTRFTKKSVNKALKEVEEGYLDIPSLKEKIKKSLLVNDLFLKESNKYEEDAAMDDLDADIDAGEADDDLDDDLEDDLEDDEFEEEK